MTNANAFRACQSSCLITSSRAISLIAALLLGIPTSACHAQQGWQPSRNVEIIVQVGPGGSSDRTARLIQHVLQEKRLVEPSVTVINKPGGGGAIAYNYLVQHSNDAHYWLISSATLLTSHVTGQSKRNYLEEITPLATLASEYTACAVRADSPIVDGKAFIGALAKNPQAFSIAISPAAGTSNHIALAMAVKAGGGEAGKLRTVIFSSSSEAVTALLGGHVDALISPVSSVIANTASGKLKVLAVSSPERLEGPLASAPTWNELGIQAVSGNWRGVVGPGGLTDAQVAYWEETLRRLVDTPEWKKHLEQYMLSPLFLNSRETRKFMDAELLKITATLRSIGLAK